MLKHQLFKVALIEQMGLTKSIGIFIGRNKADCITLKRYSVI
jgi:hypothetical protein